MDEPEPNLLPIPEDRPFEREPEPPLNASDEVWRQWFNRDNYFWLFATRCAFRRTLKSFAENKPTPADAMESWRRARHCYDAALAEEVDHRSELLADFDEISKQLAVWAEIPKKG